MGFYVRFTDSASTQCIRKDYATWTTGHFGTNPDVSEGKGAVVVKTLSGGLEGQGSSHSNAKLPLLGP